jgi:hypothetical protein
MGVATPTRFEPIGGGVAFPDQPGAPVWEERLRPPVEMLYGAVLAMIGVVAAVTPSVLLCVALGLGALG